MGPTFDRVHQSRETLGRAWCLWPFSNLFPELLWNCYLKSETGTASKPFWRLSLSLKRKPSLWNTTPVSKTSLSYCIYHSQIIFLASSFPTLFSLFSDVGPAPINPLFSPYISNNRHWLVLKAVVMIIRMRSHGKNFLVSSETVKV